MNLNEVYTLKEASYIWGTSDSNLRNALGEKFNRFDKQKKEGTVKQCIGGTWIVSKQAMEEVFGKMKTYKNINTGYILSAQELYELHIREYKEMWEDQSGAAEDFKSEDAFIKYMLDNDDPDNDFEEI